MDKKWERHSGRKPKSELNRSKLTHMRVIIRPDFLVLGLLAIELSLRCQMSELHFKFEEDRAKTAVAIVDNRHFPQTDTYRHTNGQVI